MVRGGNNGFTSASHRDPYLVAIYLANTPVSVILARLLVDVVPSKRIVALYDEGLNEGVRQDVNHLGNALQ